MTPKSFVEHYKWFLRFEGDAKTPENGALLRAKFEKDFDAVLQEEIQKALQVEWDAQAGASL